MAAEGTPALAIRSSVGVEVWNSTGFKAPYVPHPKFSRDESKFCRAIAFSPDGRYLAWTNGTNIKICLTENWTIACTIQRPKTFYIKFSPNGNYISTWEVFATSKENPDGTPNLNVYKTSTGDLVYSAVQKKNTDWEPSWSNDESILAIMIGGETLFYEVNTANGFTKTTQKIGGGRNGSISVSPGNNPFVSFYAPGLKGAPSMCKIYKYPDLQAPQPIGCKSFYQADRVELMWNKRGSGLLLLTSTDVDSTGASYYGKQALHFMSSKGDSFPVSLNKDGPIHAVTWNPNSSEFCVVYGFMPAKVSFFNLKCDSIYECEEGALNSIYYNGFGNLVILAGFGNLRGNVEIWDVAKKKKISALQAADSTLLEWCPNGELFITATTAPRLRMSNGFKVWHYSGALLHETLWPTGQELLEVIWQQYPIGFYKEKPITNTKMEGIKSSQPQASTQAYRPPNERGIKITSTKPIGDGPKSEKKKSNGGRNVPTSVGGGGETLANPPTSRKQTRNTERAKNFIKRKVEANGVTDSRGEDNVDIDSNLTVPAEATPEDIEKLKRSKNINRKLREISKLKLRKESGEHLEFNQMQKIKQENDLMKELNDLKIS